MLSVTGKNTATEFPLRGNSEMFAFAILPCFCASRTLRLAGAVAQFAQLLQFGAV
jgi:hypothetical protein